MLKKWLILVFCCPSLSQGQPHEIEQRNKQFSSLSLTIKQGESVRFTNKDPFFHNIFSLSDNKLFDLGAFAENQSREISFEKKGKVDIECAIHPNMKMTIQVK